jgi:hypothetical protein
MKYFQKTFRPDIIDGAIAKVIASSGDDAPFSQGDILFDWQAIDLPLGTDAIVDALVHMYGEDGSTQVNDDFNLLIAKSNNGVAPTTLGNENGQLSGCFELPDVLIGIMKFEADSNRVGKLNLGGHGGSIYHFNVTGNNGHVGPVVIEPEHNALGGQTTNRIYVAGISGGEFDFSTGALSNAGVSDDSATTINIKAGTTDPRKAFRAGDTVYIHDSNTPIGTIASLTSSTIVLTSNNVGAISADDEFMNAKPITVTLGFKGRG